jgi:hypothetical protein
MKMNREIWSRLKISLQEVGVGEASIRHWLFSASSIYEVHNFGSNSNQFLNCFKVQVRRDQCKW